MHVNARDLPPSKAFCFIIEHPPYVGVAMGNRCGGVFDNFTNVHKFLSDHLEKIALNQE